MTTKEFDVRRALGTLNNFEVLEDIILSTNMGPSRRLMAAKHYFRLRNNDDTRRHKVPENVLDTILTLATSWIGPVDEL